MANNLVLGEEDQASERLSRQAISFFLHVVLALGAYLAFMLAGYAINSQNVSQNLILALVVLITGVVGFFMVRMRPDEMSVHIWLAGLVWLLIVSLWILDMPTGPNACYQCSASNKLTRSLFSFPSPSGLIDDNGPFICTWPAFATLGYSIGAKFALRGRKKAELEGE